MHYYSLKVQSQSTLSVFTLKISWLCIHLHSITNFKCFILSHLEYQVLQFRSVMSDSLRPHGLYPTRLLRPWDFPGKHTGVGCHFLLQRIFLTRGSNPGFLHCRQMLYRLSHREAPKHSLRSVQFSSVQLFSRVRLFATP